MKRKKTWLYVCLTLLMLALTPAAVYGGEPDGDTADKTLAPYFFVQDAGQAADQFPLKDTSVSSTINGVIAENLCHPDLCQRGVQYPSMPATCSRHLPGLRYME